MKQIVIKYAFRIFRLIIIIFSVSYYIGIFWYIFTWLSHSENKPSFYNVYKFETWRLEDDHLDRYVYIIKIAYLVLLQYGIGQLQPWHQLVMEITYQKIIQNI
jgi:hypothetical protein